MHSVQTTPLADGSHSIQIYVGAMSILFQNDGHAIATPCLTISIHLSVHTK